MPKIQCQRGLEDRYESVSGQALRDFDFSAGTGGRSGIRQFIDAASLIPEVDPIPWTGIRVS